MDEPIDSVVLNRITNMGVVCFFRFRLIMNSNLYFSVSFLPSFIPTFILSISFSFHFIHSILFIIFCHRPSSVQHYFRIESRVRRLLRLRLSPLVLLLPFLLAPLPPLPLPLLPLAGYTHTPPRGGEALAAATALAVACAAAFLLDILITEVWG